MRAIFEVSTSLAQTDLLMYFKNLVISLPNVRSNYITNSVAFSARSLTHDNGKTILVCEHCKKQRHTKDQCWKLHGWPLRGNKRSSKEQQNSGCTDVRETTRTSQPIDPTASQTNFPTLCIIAQSDRQCSLALIARKGQIVLFDDFSLQNVLHVPKLSYNLLSISKITRELHCKATFLPDHLQGESVSEESNSTFKFIEPTPSIVSDVDPHSIILPTNQVPWKTYYKRNLRKKVGSHTSQSPAPVQDFEPPRNQETFSPISKLNTVRVLLSIAVNKDWPLYHLDVKNAFLNGDLVVEVYMSPPPGFEAQFDQQMCKLQKFLYVYVDDIVLTGDNQTEISQLKQRMGDEYEIKDLGNLKYFLGMEVSRSKEGISVSQRKYILDLLTETGMLGCRPVDTPIEFNCKLGNSDDQVLVDKEQYQRLVEAKRCGQEQCKGCIQSYEFGNMRGNLAPESLVRPSSGITKHVEIDRHFIKERLDSGSMCIPYIPSSQQVVDVLTKGLLRPHFDLCVSKLGLIDIYVPT
ncbi:Retrovirus-related Pol polyprotein from transposon TNT 1-94 [Cucumis melo var. makuwa]|uniref:Retrovirus-related Pol polyprotein from transposon TNT 1-94 n=1 Tax=Cucumis melo var. makuwa TaxID=1194695 RepID=A0A5D3DFE3_CUCMM|nr:Retrovirus-related Pol polyprotein from transposon TNT 1-94 [Cucumis melo var. makuwa]TYK22312.1 Retrovirus-related Pol polyprotein from transposon TNT 1-94 [Cucumis melo var. makuwa]